MSKTPSGIIRRLIVGSDPTNGGMAYQVGKYIGSNLVTDIVEDINQFLLFGRVRFLIYVKKDNDIRLWKAMEGVPVTIEYDLSEKVNII